MLNNTLVKLVKSIINKHTNKFLILDSLPLEIAEDIIKTLDNEGVKKIPQVREWYL